MNTMSAPKKGKKENLETWRSGDGGAQRQLDYIITSEKNGKWVKSTQTKGQSNISQMRRRKIIRLGINIALKKQEKKGRKHINYDIEELRDRPQKLRMAENEQERRNLVEKNSKRKDGRKNRKK